jgi:hypothetical protein
MAQIYMYMYMYMLRSNGLIQEATLFQQIHDSLMIQTKMYICKIELAKRSILNK